MPGLNISKQTKWAVFKIDQPAGLRKIVRYAFEYAKQYGRKSDLLLQKTIS